MATGVLRNRRLVVRIHSGVFPPIGINSLMATVTSSPPCPVRTTLSPWLTSGLYRLSVPQYDKMVENGTIPEDVRVELIEGLLVNKIGRKRPHIVAGNKGLRMLSGIIPAG